MKRIIALTVICTAALLGCGKKDNEPSPAPVTETSVSVEEVTLDSAVKEEVTAESVVVEDEPPRFYEDDYSAVYTYNRDNGDFETEKNEYKAKYGISDQDLVEKNEVNYEGTWGNYVDTIELYYSEKDEKYYVIQNTHRLTDNHGWLYLTEIKKMADNDSFYDYESFVVPDPYTFLSLEGDTGETCVDGYREEREYDNNGNLIRQTAYGVLPNWEEDGEQVILDFEYTYNNDNILIYWEQYQHSRLWGTQYCSRRYYYDQSGKLLYLSAYLTHGGVDYYYIYDGEEEPKYIITADSFGGYMYMCEYPN